MSPYLSFKLFQLNAQISLHILQQVLKLILTMIVGAGKKKTNKN